MLVFIRKEDFKIGEKIEIVYPNYLYGHIARVISIKDKRLLVKCKCGEEHSFAYRTSVKKIKWRIA